MRSRRIVMQAIRGTCEPADFTNDLLPPILGLQQRPASRQIHLSRAHLSQPAGSVSARVAHSQRPWVGCDPGRCRNTTTTGLPGPSARHRRGPKTLVTRPPIGSAHWRSFQKLWGLAGARAPRPFGGHEVVNINLKNKPDWYYTKQPFGQIPVLETSKCQLIWNSAIACEYLDDTYPGRKLYPCDPYERARQKMLLELFCKVPQLTKECLIAVRCGRGCTDVKTALCQELCNLEEVLAHQQTTFFGGNCVSMIDYLFWPWFERLDVYGIADCVDHTPKLRLWMAIMKQDPVVCALLIDKNTFLGFLNLYFQNCPDAFDHGLGC